MDKRSLNPALCYWGFRTVHVVTIGMIVHWKREGGAHWWINASANLLGALLSAVLVVCLLFLHFSNVWPYFVVMPLLLRMFYKIRKHYDEVADQLRVVEKGKVNLHDYDGSTVIVLVSNVTQVTSGAINYARSIGDYVIAMHVSFDANQKKSIRRRWNLKRNIRMFGLSTFTRRTVRLPIRRFGSVT